jgi:hypothetical protein
MTCYDTPNVTDEEGRGVRPSQGDMQLYAPAGNRRWRSLRKAVYVERTAALLAALEAEGPHTTADEQD